MYYEVNRDLACSVALHTEGVDRNSLQRLVVKVLLDVALHTEGVDRNALEIGERIKLVRQVALHTEGVDRNKNSRNSASAQPNVALHTEGVDRNDSDTYAYTIAAAVALHTEGVDRNMRKARTRAQSTWSPSTRRAWIEIFFDLA